MRRWLSALAAVAALGSAIPVEARSAHEYYVQLSANYAAPRQLDAQTADYYRAVFTAIDRQDWAGAEALLAQRDGLLHPVARAEFYLAANSPRVEAYQVEAWMERGRNLPHAPRLARLATNRGATALPSLPGERSFQRLPSTPRRTRPASIEDGTMPAPVRQAILERISNDDPDGARLLLDGIDASLSSEARAEWRQRVAWSYYIENMDLQALAMAQTVPLGGSGSWLAEGEWVAGLAAWRLGDCALATDAFERAAYQAANPELRSAAQYWAARSALRCRQPERSTPLLRAAAGADDTLYGMLAVEQLGTALPDRIGPADFTPQDWRRLGGIENIRIAIALAEIGRDRLASDLLIHQARIGDPGDYPSLTRLARELGLPSTQLWMAHNAPRGSAPDPASAYPAPKWVPTTGWRVDPALAYAHTLQESNFRANAVSPAQAQGLMQITPITVRQHAPRLGLSASQVDIFDPSVNLAFGQRNLEMLRDSPATGGTLPKIMAAYNAGLAPITRWNQEVNDQGDPLLYMESIPFWETRSYVSIVMRNYWMYERQARAASPSRLALAQNAWPGFPGTDSTGRTYLSASRD